MWCFRLCLLCLAPAMLLAVKIKAKGREVIYLAKGESAKLGCPYELEPEDNGPDGVDIEWTRMNSDPTSLDNVILSYHGRQVVRPGFPYVQHRDGSTAKDPRHFGSLGLQQQDKEGKEVKVAEQNRPYFGPIGSGKDCCSGLQQRVTFVVPDPSDYDASINLNDVQVSDSATYECKVKKTTVATRKVTVMVLDKPAVPQCWIMGDVAMGLDVTLRCVTSSGSPPFAYQWDKVADHHYGSWLPAAGIPGANPGDLIIRSLSQSHSGIYQCSVSNRVGSAQCIVEINMPSDSGPLGTIIGAILGSLMLLLTLLGLILGLMFFFRRRHQKHVATQITVDPLPPPTKCASKQPTKGYFSDNVGYGQRRKYEPPTEQQTTKTIPPPCEQEIGQAVDSFSLDGDCDNDDCPSVVYTKARIHYVPTIISPSNVKKGTLGSSASLYDLDSAPVKRPSPRHYGGVPVMVPAQTREGLLI